MARYLERAENTARILQVNQTLLLDFHVPTEQQWVPLLIISGIHDYSGETNESSVQDFMTWNRENPFSIISSIWWARENARIIREVISAEMWERINYYFLWMQRAEGRGAYDASRHEFYAQIRRINQLIHGIADATMSHGEAWEFFKLGTYLERASQMARILDVKYHTLLPKVDDVGSPVDHAHWVAILMSCSGYEPYHKKPRAPHADPAYAVAEFLIYDEQFPRSIRHCLEECRDSIRKVGTPEREQADESLTSKVDQLLDWLDHQTMQSIIQSGMHETLTHVVDSVHLIGDAVHSTFFAGDVQPAMFATAGQPHQ